MPLFLIGIIAAVKKEEDIAIGNIVGSNIFNILAILGISGTLKPFYFPEIGVWDRVFMVGSAVVLFPLMKTGFRLSWLEGAFLLFMYAGYVSLLYFK